MVATWIDDTGTATPASFYAPAFRIEAGVDEGNLQPVGDVVRVSFTDKVNEIDSFQFTVANRGWAPSDPRYTDAFPRAGDQGSDDPAPLSLLPGVRIRLWMGYVAGPLTAMLTGRVVSVSPDFSDNGVTVSVRCLNTLEELREQPRTHRWRPRSGRSTIRDLEVAQAIAASKDVELVTPSTLDEPGHRTIAQSNETDLAFLIRRAKERGYVVCFRELPTGGGRTRRLMYFGPSNLLGPSERQRLGDRTDPYELRWGASLVDLRPTLNLSTTLWRKVKLSFWDRRAGRRVPLSYDIEKLWADEQGLNRDLQPVIDDAAIGEHELSNQPVHTRDEATALLRNKLRENFLGLLTGQGTTVGLPALRCGAQVEVSGVGAPFDGTWFVTSTTHTIDDNGYRTTFEARREQRNGASA